jgi:hypothetical protein
MLSLKVVKALLSVAKPMLKVNGGTKEGLSRIHVKNGVLTVTDGHRAYQIPTTEPDGLYNCESVEYQSKMPNAKKDGVDIAIADQSTDEFYPSVDHIFPATHGDEFVKIVFNAHYMKELCEMAIAGHSHAFIQLNVNKDYGRSSKGIPNCTAIKPSVAYFKADEAGSVGRAILMPVQMRNGVLEWTGKAEGTAQEPAQKEAIAA